MTLKIQMKQAMLYYASVVVGAKQTIVLSARLAGLWLQRNVGIGFRNFATWWFSGSSDSRRLFLFLMAIEFRNIHQCRAGHGSVAPGTHGSGPVPLVEKREPIPTFDGPPRDVGR